MMFDGTEHAIYAVEGPDEVVGVLCWGIEAATGDVVARLSYVEPSSRRLGIFRAMWHELLVRVRQSGAARIVTDVHPKNELVPILLEKLDMAPISNRYAVSLPTK